MILSKHHKDIIQSGYDYIKDIGIKKYAMVLGKRHKLNWDGIRKEIGLMRRYGVI